MSLTTEQLTLDDAIEAHIAATRCVKCKKRPIAPSGAYSECVECRDAAWDHHFAEHPECQDPDTGKCWGHHCSPYNYADTERSEARIGGISAAKDRRHQLDRQAADR